MDRPQTLTGIFDQQFAKRVEDVAARSNSFTSLRRLIEPSDRQDFKLRRKQGMSFFANFLHQRERRAADAIIGIDEAQQVERLEPDLAVEYARLAPLVTEAFVLLEVGRTDEARKALHAAQEVIQTVSSPFFSSVMVRDHKQ
ncbi:MAG: hypothetical protein E6Q76_03700 [Rhizobium sp.]|nr:MAG: hypothetical protein E6Q76_03700 [Rhizobium sp.]